MRTLLALLLLATPAIAAAEGPFEGTWRAGPLEIRNQTESWGADCPMRLPATQTEPGGEVRITQSGDQLTFTGAVRGGTNRCWSEQPALRRVSSTFQGGRWTTICRTPSEIAQAERGTYTWRASGESTLAYEETTRWDWRLNTSHCVATRTARRTLTRVTAAPVAEAPPPTMEPEPEPEPERCTPGAPARLRVSPLDPIAPGDRACVRARVVDANGCTVPNAPLEVSVLGEARGRLEGRCFVAASAGSEGAVRIAVRSRELSEVVTLRVETEDLTALTARRLRESSSRATGPQAAEAEGASGVAARALEGDPGALAWVGGSVALLVIAGVVVLIVARRRRAPAPGGSAEAAREPTTGTAAQAPIAGDVPALERMATAEAAPKPVLGDAAREPIVGDVPPPQRIATAAPPPSQTKSATPAAPVRRVCPSCGAETEGRDFCPHDGARLLDLLDPTLRAQGMICPTCRRGYPADARSCSQDGAELLPYPVYAARQKQWATAAHKICPKCGTHYDAGTTFCGKDGSPLRPLD